MTDYLPPSTFGSATNIGISSSGGLYICNTGCVYSHIGSLQYFVGNSQTANSSIVNNDIFVTVKALVCDDSGNLYAINVMVILSRQLLIDNCL